MKRAIVIGLVLALLAAAVATVPMNVGAYMSHGPILIDGNSEFTAANGVCKGSGTAADPYVIKNWDIDGGGTGSCINIKNTDAYFVVKGCNVYNTGSGIYDGGIVLENVKNGEVKGNIASNCNEGILLVNSHGNTIKDNICQYNTWDGVWLEKSDYNIVKDNILSYNDVDVLVWTDSHYNVVRDNNMGTNARYSIVVAQSSNNEICDNAIFDVVSDGIYMSSAYQNLVADNTIARTGGNAIFTYYCYENTFQNNMMSENLQGIYSYGSWDSSITGNIITDSYYRNMMFFYGYGNTITGNTVSGAMYQCIFLRETDYNKICGNEMSNADLNGFCLMDADNNLVAKNYIHDSNQGINMRVGCANNIVEENTLTMNEYGFYFYYSQGSYIYHNSIIKNAVQLYSDSSAHTWDDNMGMGNYWSDYKGKDTDHDGVGDTMLPHQGVDHYPLMKPY